MTAKVFALRQTLAETTVAHLIAAYRRILCSKMTFKVLSMKDNDNYSVAHVLAENGFLPEECSAPETLALKGRRGTDRGR